ncbi:MAG: Clp protease N-terminal domain-containing protein, partial [Spirosomataceae bacterium]
MNTALANAEKELKAFGDEYISVELLLLGLLNGSDNVAKLLKESGFKSSELTKAIKELRGNNKTVTDPNAEDKYQALSRYSINLNEQARLGKID